MPNFFIAGAPKAGTDLLFYQLDQHPEIYMSPMKEPNFFSAEVRPANFHPSLHPHMRNSEEMMQEYFATDPLPKRFGGVVTSRADYERLFVAVEAERAVGEGSVCYLWSQTAAKAISEAVPGAKIILVLMDPAERAFHQYLKSLADGNVSHSFSVHLDLAFEDRKLPQWQVRLFNPFLAFGQYTGQVQRYLEHFAREQLLISIYEDVRKDYGSWWRQVLDFLQVDSSFVPPEVEVPSTPHFKSGLEPGMLPQERRRLVEFYRDDIHRLQEFLGIELRHWLE